MIAKNRQKFTDADNEHEWSKLLKEFTEITSDGKKHTQELNALKEKATQNPNLSGRQSDAIWARCENYINGTYGSTSKTHSVGA